MFGTGSAVDPLGKKELLHFYNRHLKDFGDSPQAVRWTPDGQRLRYETLLRIAGDFSGKRIVDFGCGKGDFYGFIREKGLCVNYCGIDVNEKLIGLAGKKYPEAEFITADIEETDIGRKFDIGFVCGVFNLRIAGIEASMKDALKKLSGICEEAIHVNCLTYYVPRKDIELFYVRPEEILQFAITELSGSVILRHFREDIFLSIFMKA
jgi:SAM-dependent methyltransferase